MYENDITFYRSYGINAEYIKIITKVEFLALGLPRELEIIIKCDVDLAGY